MPDTPTTEEWQSHIDVTIMRALLQWAIGIIDEMNGGPLLPDQWGEDSGLYWQARTLAFPEHSSLDETGENDA